MKQCAMGVAFAMAVASMMVTGSRAEAGETEDAVVAACVANGATDPASLVSCAGGTLTLIEATKLLNGDAFGENNTARKIFERPGEALKDLFE